MAPNKTQRVAIALPSAYRNHLELQALRTSTSMTGIMAEMIMDVIDDDRAAHGESALSREGYKTISPTPSRYKTATNKGDQSE